MRCPGCGKENREGARFCDGCGERLSAAAREGERRQLTVVFCDLIGSTALSQQLDPEDLRHVMGAYQDVVARVVRAHGGKVAILLGDGVLTYLGYPDAHEDDAERAVRAALRIVDEIRTLNRSWAGEPGRAELSVRVAAHTGDVVVSELQAAGAGIFGETPNLAARLQSVAPPNGVVVSEDTHRLVQGMFRVEDLGEQRLTGVDRAVRAFQVLAPSGVRSRLRVASSSTPLIGREAELDTLWQAWSESSDTGGRAVLVVGEAGVGKSRLVQGLQARMEGTPHTWLECGGSAYMRDSAFAPVIQLQSAALRFSSRQSDAEKLAVLEAGVGRAGMPLLETVPFLARLHSLDLPPDSDYARAIDGGLSPENIRRRTKDAAREWLLRMGRQQPVVLLVEDLHWMDPSSLELVGEILPRLPDTRALMILTARPDFEAPWAEHTYTRIALGHLDDEAAARLVRALAGDALDDEQVEAVVERTDGVPLFVEEMTKAAVAAAGAPTGQGVGVPATLKGLLMARIDRLGPAKDVAQIGATIGREFGEDLLRLVWPGEADALDPALARLTEAELVDHVKEASASRYVFKHALIQDTAYESLLRATRVRIHDRIAQALESEFPTTVETRPELIAWHFTQAGATQRAIDYWEQAGQRAAERSANVEASRHLESGLACVAELPAGPERLGRELVLRTRLGANLIAVKGYGAEEVLENISRARALCDRLGDSPLTFPVLYNLWVFHLMRSSPETVQYADEVLDMARRTDPERMLVWAHVAQAITRYWQADYAAARDHAVACREHYYSDPTHIPLFGDDPGAYGYVYDGMPSWIMGEPVRARECLDQAVRTAEGIGYSFTVAGALAFRCQLLHFARDLEAMGPDAGRTVTLTNEQHFPVFLASSLAHLGWAKIGMGEADAGLETMRQGVGLYRATGAVLNTHYFESLVAEAHLARGEVEEGLAAVERGLELVERHLDRIFLPELHRLKGALLRAADAEDAQAEASFQRAIDEAERAGAVMLGLRAAVDLGRHRSAEGRTDEGRDLVAHWLDRVVADDAGWDAQRARRFLSHAGSA